MAVDDVISVQSSNVRQIGYDAEAQELYANSILAPTNTVA